VIVNGIIKGLQRSVEKKDVPPPALRTSALGRGEGLALNPNAPASSTPPLGPPPPEGGPRRGLESPALVEAGLRRTGGLAKKGF
jgi:hypothetical protein